MGTLSSGSSHQTALFSIQVDSVTMKRVGVSRRSKVTTGNRLGLSTTRSLGPSRREQRLADAKALRNAEIAGNIFIHSLTVTYH